MAFSKKVKNAWKPKSMLDIECDIFGDTQSGKEKVFMHHPPLVHKDDHEPYSLIMPDIQRGPWIAGGAPLRWFVNQPCRESDIDVFCSSVEQADKIVKRITSFNRYQTMAKTANAITIRYFSQTDKEKSWLIQIIYVRFYQSLQAVINNFDISVCQIGTCGDEWVLGEYTVRDIKNKQLRFTCPLRDDSMKRLLKYWTYGFEPIPGLVEEFQLSEHKWKMQENEPYSNAF